MATWNDAVPTAANQVLADITAIRENLDELEAVVENLTGDALGTDEPSTMQVLYNKIGTYVDGDEAISGASSKTFTGLETGKHYRIEIELYGIDGAESYLALRFGNSGGIDSGAAYGYHNVTYASEATNYSENQVIFSGFTDGSEAFFIIDFSSRINTTTSMSGIYHGVCPGTITFCRGSFTYAGGSAVDRVQILTVTNLDPQTFSGRIRLYRTN